MTGIVDLNLDGLVKSVGSVIGDLVTTDKERMQLELQGRELDQKGDLAQIDVNKTEAQSSMLFVAGWRPAVGWVGAAALAMAYIPKCAVITALWTYQAIVVVSAWKSGAPPPLLPAFPDLGLGDVLGLLGSILGMGAMRHLETMNGVARDALPAQQQKLTKNPDGTYSPVPASAAIGQQEAP